MSWKDLFKKQPSDPEGYIPEGDDDPTAAELGKGPPIVRPQWPDKEAGPEDDPQSEQRRNFEAAQLPSVYIVHPAEFAIWGIGAATGKIQYT